MFGDYSKYTYIAAHGAVFTYCVIMQTAEAYTTFIQMHVTAGTIE